ncbi:MAG: hypothetical protein WCB46_09855, partial [Methanoregula sp.]
MKYDPVLEPVIKNHVSAPTRSWSGSPVVIALENFDEVFPLLHAHLRLCSPMVVSPWLHRRGPFPCRRSPLLFCWGKLRHQRRTM